MLKISKWYNYFQSPAVLMIDDLSDACIDVYPEKYKNDWGYFCDTKGSSFDYLSKKLLDKFPEIKITFFTPYLKHNVINENSEFRYKKFAVGERVEFIYFLKKLKELGHEIAHHGSDHGKYINDKIPSTVNNWMHEWALFDNIEEGIKKTLDGIKIFQDKCEIIIVGGKYCGYIQKENSQDIIDKCNFLYWCDKPSYTIKEYDENIFGENNVISFPTNYPGNAFVRLSYMSGDIKRDKKKKILKYFQSIYNIYAYFKLFQLYKNQNIISIQEHYSPSTTAGTVQSANIVTDIKSLEKIFDFLSGLSIWYATCADIAKYIYVRENSEVVIENNHVTIKFNNYKNIDKTIISLVSNKSIILRDAKNIYYSTINNKKHVINLEIHNGINHYEF